MLGHSALETAFVGNGWQNGEVPAPPVNRVRSTLLGLRYFNSEGPLTGMFAAPHLGLPLALG